VDTPGEYKMPDSWHTLRELEGLQVEGLEQVIKSCLGTLFREGVKEEKEGGGGRRRQNEVRRRGREEGGRGRVGDGQRDERTKKEEAGNKRKPGVI
jgi:hypothetical protein